MRAPRFIHLRLHSAHSLLEGAIQIGALADACRKAKMPAVALTDTGNLFAAMEFSSYMAKAGVQPIIGCQIDLAHAAPAHPGDKPPAPRPVVLLAQDEAGYGNLLALSSAAYLDSGDALPHVPIATLAAHAEGLICLTGGSGGPLGALIAEGQPARAAALARAAGGDLSRAALHRGPATPRWRRAAHRCRGGDRAGAGGHRLRP